MCACLPPKRGNQLLVKHFCGFVCEWVETQKRGEAMHFRVSDSTRVQNKGFELRVLKSSKFSIRGIFLVSETTTTALFTWSVSWLLIEGFRKTLYPNSLCFWGEHIKLANYIIHPLPYRITATDVHDATSTTPATSRNTPYSQTDMSSNISISFHI